MTTSLPSREIVSINVPTPSMFAGAFMYNFFVNDEMVAETSVNAAKFAQRPADSFDAKFQQYATSRIPRFVRLSWTTTKQTTLPQATRAFGVPASRPTNLIKDNLTKIIDEDQFTSSNFVAVNFHNGEIEDQIYEFVSGSYLQRIVDSPTGDSSPRRAALRLSSLTPKTVTPDFLSKAMTLPKKAGALLRPHVGGRAPIDSYFDALLHVSEHVQINGKVFHDIVDRTIRDPHAPYSSDLVELHKFSRASQQALQTQFNPAVSVDDYKNVVPFVDIKPAQSHVSSDALAEVIGYVIDKVEVLPNGAVRAMQPIVIENADAGMTLDLNVRYGATYMYSCRSVAKFVIPAIDEDDAGLSSATVLISSHPVKSYVTCVNDDAPPPPADLNFTWDYQNNKLCVRWSFPTNSQRDIKKFQVFRRSSTDAPFELVKMYDFDDSVMLSSDNEDVDQSLVETLTNPALTWIDDDFVKSSTFIYSVVSIDAHGLTSNYSAQFELSFNVFKNHIVKRLVSHSGAPKAYPNLYLEADAFVDTIRDQGSSRVRVFFNPEYYAVTNDAGHTIPVIATEQTGGKYTLQFINVDVQKVQSLDVIVNDMITR